MFKKTILFVRHYWFILLAFTVANTALLVFTALNMPELYGYNKYYVVSDTGQTIWRPQDIDAFPGENWYLYRQICLLHAATLTVQRGLVSDSDPSFILPLQTTTKSHPAGCHTGKVRISIPLKTAPGEYHYLAYTQMTINDEIITYAVPGPAIWIGAGDTNPNRIKAQSEP